MGRSRGGLSTKNYALVDAEGRPIRLTLTPDQAHDSTAAEELLANLKPGATLLADKAYDSNALQEQAQEKDVWANIPPKSNRKGTFVFGAFLYRYRNLVERYFNKLKQFLLKTRAGWAKSCKPSCGRWQISRSLARSAEWD
jgi:transposase